MSAAGKPGDHPMPTAALAARNPVIHSYAGPFYRIYRETHLSPLYFGRTKDYRFDSARGDCGVLYAAPDLEGAWFETFMQELGRTTVSEKELSARPVALIKTLRPLSLIDLCVKGGQSRLGMDGRICTASYAVAQAWSDALRNHPIKPDGILFPSRHELSVPSCAIFESAAPALQWSRWGTLNEPHLRYHLVKLLAMSDVGLTS